MTPKNILKVIVALVLVPLMLSAQKTAKKPFTGKAEDGWFLYYLGADGSEGYVSIDRGYAVRNNLVLISTLLDYPRTGKYTVMTEIYDCTASQYALLGKTDYDKNDNELRSYENDKSHQKYTSITASSRQRILLDGICRSISMTPVSAAEARRYFEDFDKAVRKARDGR